MNESENAFLNNNEEVWDFIKEHPRYIGIPISNNKGLDILNALRDVWIANKTSQEKANNMLTMLAAVLVSAEAGHGDEIVEEVLVQEAMMDFEEQAKEILNERPE
jgi:hypothetical protein